MIIPNHSFQTIDWSTIEKQDHAGETGHATWQVLFVGDIRIRRMEYSKGYQANHWCKKGHIIHCTEGELFTELEDGRKVKLVAGMTYIVGDNCEAHKSSTPNGCVLFVVD